MKVGENVKVFFCLSALVTSWGYKLVVLDV